MREIKVTVYQGDITRLAGSDYNDSVQSEVFQRTNGMAVQQFAYRCARKQDRVGTVCGDPQNVIIDFAVCVMQTQPNIYYEKLFDIAPERFSFLFNALYENDKLKSFDNAIMAEGYIVDVEEEGSNNNDQAVVRVKLLTNELTYLRKNNETLTLNISK